MKKTTLLIIGAMAFVLQSAMAQETLYFDNFEGQTLGNNPQNIGTDNISTLGAFGNIGGGNAGNTANFPTTTPPGTDPGEGMWNWVGGGGGNNGVNGIVWQTASLLDSSQVFNSQMLQFGWTDLGNNVPGGWWGFSTQAHTTTAANGGNQSFLTLSFDILLSGSEFAGGNPIKIWFDQFPGGVKTMDAYYQPSVTTDGTWQHVEFSLADLTKQGAGNYDPSLGIEIAFDAGDGPFSRLAGDTANIQIDNIMLTSVPEPGTIALLTLGGLGALVAIRRRRA